MNISTVKLQALVAKAVKGAGFNKLLPITGMIGISVATDKLQLSTSDGTNYMYLWDELNDLPEPFNVTVDADVFAKLVGKLTSDKTELYVEGNKLIVKANGTYKLPLCMSDSGEPLEYPRLSSELSDDDKIGTLTASQISTIVNTLKPTLSTNVATIYANYLFTDYVVSTDRTMLNAYLTEDRLFSEDMLISREFMDLLSIANSDADIYKGEGYLVAIAKDVEIYSKSNTDISDFNKSGTQAMLDLQYDSYCKLKKSALMSLLERIALFVGDYGSTAIRLNFNQQGLEVTSNSDAGTEVIEYMESKDFKETSIKIDVNKLLTQLKAYQSDAIDLYYGNKMSIRLKDGDIVQVIALIA